MSSTLYSAEFRAGLANLIKNMVDDALSRYPAKGKEITLSATAIEGTCQFLTDCVTRAGVSHHRVHAQVDTSRYNPNGETTVFEASISLDGTVLYRFTGEMFNALALAAVVSCNEATPAKRDPASVEAANLMSGLRVALKSLLEQYPQPTTPFAITDEEVMAFVEFTGPFFDIRDFTTHHSCQTGPDNGQGTFVLTMFTLSIYKGQSKVYEADISPEYIRAFLASRTHLGAESERLETSPFERITVGVEVKVLDEELYWGKDIAPCGSADSAGIDLQAAVTEDTFLEPGETKLIPTGLAFYLANPNFVGLIHPRSGLGHKHGIVLGNLTGVIDADYNGQLMVSLWNRNTQGEPYKISRGDRIAQYLIQPVVKGDFKQVKEFSTPSERGGKGFGSSGVGQQVTLSNIAPDVTEGHSHVDGHWNVKKAPVGLGDPDGIQQANIGPGASNLNPEAVSAVSGQPEAIKIPPVFSPGEQLLKSVHEPMLLTDCADEGAIDLDAVKDKTLGERMNETRPRIFKNDAIFIKEERAERNPDIMVNLQAAIDAHNGTNFKAEELSDAQLEAVIKWALDYIGRSGGDPTLVNVVVERTQDWNHEAGQLFNRRANMNLFFTDTQFVRISHPACTFVLKNYVNV